MVLLMRNFTRSQDKFPTNISRPPIFSRLYFALLVRVLFVCLFECPHPLLRIRPKT